ncbi:hypothetical protein ABZP36_010985 [Zizania latifolia]
MAHLDPRDQNPRRGDGGGGAYRGGRGRGRTKEARTGFFGTPDSIQFLGVRPLLRRLPRGVTCGLRRRPSKYKNEKVVAEDNTDGGGEDDNDDHALEALFKQLEEDLKNDDLSVEDDDDVSEEDMARFERELAEVIGDISGIDESEGDSSSGSEGYGNDEK